MSSFEKLKVNPSFAEYLNWFSNDEEHLKKYCKHFDEKISEKVKLLKPSYTREAVKEIFKKKMEEDEASGFIDHLLIKEDEKLLPEGGNSSLLPVIKENNSIWNEFSDQEREVFITQTAGVSDLAKIRDVFNDIASSNVRLLRKKNTINALDNMIADLINDAAQKGKAITINPRDKEKCLRAFLELNLIPNNDQLYVVYRNNELVLQSNYLWERDLLCQELGAQMIALDIYTESEAEKVDFSNLKCNKMMNIKGFPEEPIPPEKVRERGKDGKDEYKLNTKSSNIKYFVIYPIFKDDDIEFKSHLRAYSLGQIVGRVQKIQGFAWNSPHNILEMLKKHVFRTYGKECLSASSLIRKIDIAINDKEA